MASAPFPEQWSVVARQGRLAASRRAPNPRPGFSLRCNTQAENQKSGGPPWNQRYTGLRDDGCPV